MADTAASILAPAVTELARWVGDVIKRQFNYLCCFTSNIATLKKETEYLQDTAADLQQKVDRAKDDLRVISNEVKTWLKDCKDIKDEIHGILKEVPNVGTGCSLQVGARFSLSKRAMKSTDRLKELRDKCKFHDDAISHPPPPASTQPIPSEKTYDFESRKQIEEEIMETLRLGDVNMIGICGMGGLGKTTMAKRVANRALEEQVFEEVVMVVVSQMVDKSRVQLEIGGSLGLKLEGEIGQASVQKLHARLSGAKRILLVLDDVWETLELEPLGIPTNHTSCKILLTSRNRDVLSAMNVRKIFGMNVLSEEDSWLIFRERAGTCVDETNLNSIAKEVVNKCEGLPIALTTVGAALTDEMNVGVWEDALRQLRQCDPDITTLIPNVYNPLKLSYDALGPKHKSAFLLCCLYPEDANIPIEHLTYFCLGLGIFEGLRNVEETRNRMRALTNMLKRRSLLLDGRYGGEFVRMHDVVRDVCIFIARKEGYIGGNDCSWISLSQSIQLPTELRFPNLRLLMWNNWIRNSVIAKFKLDTRFVEGVRDLHVLSIEKDDSLKSLPLTTQFLNNLKTLVLEFCWKLDALSGVGELVNLEILICRHCSSIEELPVGMKGLNRLKVLDLTSCRNLKRIGRGIISSLVGLEELKMLWSFKEWEAEDREERENAALRELEALINLRHLMIEIKDPALAAENMRLPSKMIKYHIQFTSFAFDYGQLNKRMSLVLEEESSMGHWIEMQLLRDTECLILDGNGANKVDLTKLKNIRRLELRDCESMKKMDDLSGATALSPIEHLSLKCLPQLEEIWDVQMSSNIFQNLKTLKLDGLEALKQVWEGRNLGMNYFPQLECLDIENCRMMERVFSWDGEEGNEDNSIQLLNSHHIATKILSKLNKLKLVDLPNLTSLFQGIQRIEFPQLTSMRIQNCGKVKVKVSKWKESNENSSEGSSSKAQIQHGQPQEMSFRCLEELKTDWSSFGVQYIDVSLFNGLEVLNICCYKGSMSIMTPLIVENLFNLKELYIDKCEEMVKVIEGDEEKLVSVGEKTLLFPKLQKLELSDLMKLERFCEWKCDVELPSLRELSIKSCIQMENFTVGPLTTPNLKYVHMDGDDYSVVGEDLNWALKVHMAKQMLMATKMLEAIAEWHIQQWEKNKDAEAKGSEGEIVEEQSS